jgi:hypothetical protein
VSRADRFLDDGPPVEILWQPDVVGRSVVMVLPGSQILLRHLPGKHDQSTHGRGKGSYSPGKDLLAAGNAEGLAEDIDAEASQHVTGTKSDTFGAQTHIGPHGDEQLAAIAKKQGFDAKPDVVSEKDMDQLVATGKHTEVFRGVQDGGPKSAKAIQEQFRHGDYYAGLGVKGNGTYTTRSREQAMGLAGGDRKALLRLGLRPQAKVVQYADLKAEHKAFYDRLPQGSAARRVFSDPGTYAAARGYDAIQVVHRTNSGRLLDTPDYFVILNRSAVVAEAG